MAWGDEPIPAECTRRVHKEKKDPTKHKVDEKKKKEEPKLTVDLKEILAKKPDQKLAWATRAVELIRFGTIKLNLLYDMLSHPKFFIGFEGLGGEGLGGQLRTLVEENKDMFSEKQLKFFESDKCKLSSFTLAAGSDSEEDAPAAERKTTFKAISLPATTHIVSAFKTKDKVSKSAGLGAVTVAEPPSPEPPAPEKAPPAHVGMTKLLEIGKQISKDKEEAKALLEAASSKEARKAQRSRSRSRSRSPLPLPRRGDRRGDSRRSSSRSRSDSRSPPRRKDSRSRGRARGSSSRQTSSNIPYVWRQAGIDYMKDKGLYEKRGKPEAGSRLNSVPPPDILDWMFKEGHIKKGSEEPT